MPLSRDRSHVRGGPARVAIAAALLLGAAAAPAAAAATLGRSNLHGGGTGGVQAGAFVLRGGAGQPDAGTLVSGGYVLLGGFWAGGGALVAVEEPPPGPPSPRPLAFRVHPLAPNPATSRAAVRFDLPDEAPVRLTVLDVQGRHVRTVFDGRLPPGSHERAWDARGADGARAHGGLYIVLFESGERRVMRKLVLLP